MSETTPAKAPLSTKKRGQAKPEPRTAALKEHPVTLDQLQNLTSAVEKLATLTGHGNMLKEFGLKMWQPSPKDMHRFK